MLTLELRRRAARCRDLARRALTRDARILLLKKADDLEAEAGMLQRELEQEPQRIDEA
jgi:hypothetical protein